MHYNRFDPADNIDEIRFRSDRILQSAELNELQSAAAYRLRGIADALFKDGDVIRDARIVVDADTGATQCESGAIYLSGAVRGVAPANLVIPVVGIVNVGIYLQTEVIDETDDPALLNPAVGTRGYMEPGAERTRITPVWGYGGDGTTGEFFPVWIVEDGYVRAKEPPPNLDAVTQALARYDRDSAGGTYIVSGLTVVKAADLPNGDQVYTVSEGRARVDGYAIDLTAGRRVVYDAAPELRYIDSEPHASTTVGVQRIDLDRPPASALEQVRITAQRTVDIVHGGFAGAADPLPEAAVLSIDSVTQGATTFAPTTDYTLTAGQVDWSPAGAEPAPGSTYSVTITYIKMVEPEDFDGTGFSVTGALPGTLVLVSYRQMLRRIDRLCIDSGGSFTWVRGVSAEWSPQSPVVPGSLLPLASVYQSWDANRRIIADGVRVVPMVQLAGIEARQRAVAEDLAELRLAVDIAGRDSGVKKGLFADPFISDAMRDAGIAQTAAVVGGALCLPIDVVAHHIGLDITTPISPAHDLVPVIEQTLRTGGMQINPYLAFQPLPAAVTLVPLVDRWTAIDTEWSSPITERLYSGSGSVQAYAGSRTSVRTLSEQNAAIEHLRPITVRFECRGFGPGELLQRVTFDGIEVPASPLPAGTLAASASGVVVGTFVIPADVPSGVKLVEFVGAGGSRGTQTFTGQGTQVLRRQQQVTSEIWQQSTPPATGNPFVIGPGSGGSSVSSSPCASVFVIGPSTDPLAQTFTAGESFHSAGVDLWFTAKGSSDVVVQVREAQLGLPTSSILAETRLDPGAIAIGGATRVTWSPVQLVAGREYALVVLCDDAVSSLAIAELGKWDSTAGRWVTAQPYQVGVLLSSSNANTWTAHQDRDLAFRILRASYTQAERVIDLGTVDLVGATDLMILGYADRPAAAADAIYDIVIGEHTVSVADGQVVWLAAPTTAQAHVFAKLRGAERFAAVLAPGVQLIEGRIQPTATYVTRTINGGVDVTVKVVFQALLPGGSSLLVEMQADGSADWVAVPYLSAGDPTAGVREIVHQLEHVTAGRLRVRLTLQGGTAARPQLYNLRVVAL